MLYSEWRTPSSRKLILSYLTDWILVCLMAGAFFALDAAQPFHREFSLTDKTIMHAYTEHEAVPTWMLGLVCFVAPFVIIAIVSLGIKRSTHDFHSGVLGLCLALSLSVVFTQLIKITVGRPRPDFLDRCQPPLDAQDPPLGLSNYTICSTDINSHLMKDGFKSFPSGHSSFSFAGLGYLALYFAGKLRMFDERGHTYKGFTFIIPLIGALLVVISRTRDYRHHWQDVTIGSLLGIACAIFAYRQYHPGLGHERCHQPFALRFRSDLLPVANSSPSEPRSQQPPSRDEETLTGTSTNDNTAYNRYNANRESTNALLAHEPTSQDDLYDRHAAQQKIQLQYTSFN
ncbi:phosphatidic acid phosphatase type 2/haloperoxidase [Gongronella butleri]|nr:phosphatidic acid phosphatase type 2/haloperoxidase [Gongronella butleri]